MSIENNKQVVRRLYEDVVGRQRDELIEELIAPLAYDHNAHVRGWGEGIAGFRRHVRFLAEVFPDAQISIDELVADGDRVVAFWHFVGTHRGELWGVPPTGRRVEAHTVSLLTVHEGKVVEYESRPDRLALLSQLGRLGDYGAAFAERGAGR